MNSDLSKSLIKSLAKKFNVPFEEVKKAVTAQFLATSKAFKEGNRKELIYKTIYLPKFGTFKVKEGRKRYLKEVYVDRETKTEES